jgi:hypothetical protein
MFGDANGLRFGNGFGLTCRFRLFFAMVKIQGTPCMRSHIWVHRATTKYFSNSLVFKTNIEKEGLPGDSTPDLGTGVLPMGQILRFPEPRFWPAKSTYPVTTNQMG